MNSANAGKTQDPEKFLAPSPSTSLDQIRLLKETEAKNRKAVKMQRLQHLLFTLLVLAVLTIGVVCSSSNNIPRRNVAPALPPYPASPVEQVDASSKEFQELLNTVEPSSLHEVLHQHLKEKYRHGVYQEDKKAMEVVHQQNAEVAQSLIELAKRQQGADSTNGSSVVRTTATSTVPVTVTSGSSSTVPESSTVVVKTSTSTTAQTSQASTSVPSSTGTSPSQSSTSAGVSTSTASTRVVSSTTNADSVSTTSAVSKTTTKDGKFYHGAFFSPFTANSSAYYPVQNQSSISVPPSIYPTFPGYVYISSARPILPPSPQNSSSVSLAAPSVYAPVRNSSAVSATPTLYSPMQSSSSSPAQNITAAVYAPT
jgi:hypothetical protein